MPSAMHAKGFLPNYAQFLHLDVNELLVEFAALTGTGGGTVTTKTAPPQHSRMGVAAPYSDPADPSAPVMLPASPPPASEPARPVHITAANRSGPAVPRTMAGGRGSVAAPSAPTWAAPTYQPPQEGEQPRPRSLPRRMLRSNLVTAIVLAAGSVGIIWWTTNELSKVSIREIVPTTESGGLIEQIAGSATVPASATFQPTSTQVVEFTGPQVLDRVILRLSVEQRSWMRVTVDGVVQFEGQAEPGTVQNYEGEETIIVRAGNAAGLIVTYNGMELGPLGERGQLVERFYTTSGQITPTPTPTITATSTAVPSPTPRFTPTPSSNRDN